MSTARHIDENGYLHISGCPISSFGIFQYSVGQVDPEGKMNLGDPNRVINVFRPESAVNDPGMFASFKNMPLIDDHTMLSGFQGDEEEVAPEDKGIDGILTSNIYYDEPWLRGDLVVYSRKMQKLILQGKKDLSLGYSCQFIQESGTFDGQPYEVIQIDLRGNHIALVGEGRVPGARVLDGRAFDCLSFSINPSIKENNAMALPAKKKPVKVKAADSAVEQLQILLPQLTAAMQGFLQEESAEPEHQGEQNAEGVQAETQPEQQTAQPEASSEEADAMSAIEAAGAAPQGEETSTPEVSGEQQTEQGEQATPALPELVAQLEALLSQLKSACGQGGAQDEENVEQAADNVEGLNEQSSVEGAQVSTDESETQGEGGNNQPPQEKGKPSAKAEDAALARFYADSADKARKYDRLSKVVGTFDHRAMDSHQVSAYGVKKLGIKCAPGTEAIALDAYLTGIEAGMKKTAQAVQTKAADAAVGCPEITAYLAGGK